MKKLIIIFLLISCKKETQNLPNDAVLESKELNVMRRKPPHNPPPSYKSGCLLLDFDGQNISSLWNVSSVNSSGLTQSQIASVLTRVQYDYSFDDSIIVTTNESVYNSFPENKRVRCVITTSWEWYGQYGGVAYLNSFGWYGEKECFVFSSLLGLNAKYISDAVSHELAHTTGARHHSDWIGCVFVNPYLVGDDIMGNSYAASNPLFKIAANDICCTCIEDTKQVIRNAINQ